MKKTLLLALLFFSPVSFAYFVQNSVTPTLVGSQNDGDHFGTIICMTDNPHGCVSACVYFDTTTPNYKQALAVGLTAKATDKTLRLDFTQDSSGLCSGTGAFIE